MSLTDDILMHYGMPRRSGRYPWGSGDNPYQHSGDFLSRVEELKMLIGLAHDRIIYLGMAYIERGYITQDEYENLYELLSIQWGTVPINLIVSYGILAFPAGIA